MTSISLKIFRPCSTVVGNLICQWNMYVRHWKSKELRAYPITILKTLYGSFIKNQLIQGMILSYPPF